MRYKKYFYALRPLLAARYIETRHAVPPVLFDELLRMELDPSLRSAIDLLLEKKKLTTEGEYLPHLPEIREYNRGELPRQKAICQAMADDRNRDWTALNRCFLEILGLEANRED